MGESDLLPVSGARSSEGMSPIRDSKEEKR